MIDLKIGDCLEKMKDIEDNSVDFILCDPPYELAFMGKKWDNTGIAFNIKVWKEALRVLKPGGYLMAFSGSRTYHRMAVAIEDADFEVKDMIEWVYSTGFPKALDISKAINAKIKTGGSSPKNLRRDRMGENYKPTGQKDYAKGRMFSSEIENDNTVVKLCDIAKQYEGYKSQLKPAHEPICLAMKPLSEKNFAENVMKWGTGSLNIDGTRVGNEKRTYSGVSGSSNTFIDGCFGKGESNKTQYEVEGRYPANLIIHENIAPVLDSQSGYSKSRRIEGGANRKSQEYTVINPCGWRESKRNKKTEGHNDEGGASRYFKNIEDDDNYIPFIYHAKASKKDRNIDINGEVLNCNNHATVKPTGLMKYLLKMGLPPIHNAVVLDMFAGSGSTGVALEMLNKEEGTNHKCILIEREEEYAKIIKKRCCL